MQYVLHSRLFQEQIFGGLVLLHEVMTGIVYKHAVMCRSTRTLLSQQAMYKHSANTNSNNASVIMRVMLDDEWQLVNIDDDDVRDR